MTKPTPLLDQLSQAAREEAREDMHDFDDRWDRLAAGTLGEEEKDELLGLADASGKAYEAYQAFKPLGPAFQQSIAAAIVAQQAKERDADVPAEDGFLDPAVAAAPPPKKATQRSLLFGGFASAASLVMGALLVFQMQNPLSTYTGERPRGGYTLRSNGPVGEEFDRIPRFENSNAVNLIFKASVPPGTNIEARLYTFGADSKLQLTPLLPAIDNDGSSVKFEPILGQDLVLSPGSWDLVVVISRPGKFPDDAALLEAVKINGRGDTYWQVLVTPIEVEKDEG